MFFNFSSSSDHTGYSSISAMKGVLIFICFLDAVGCQRCVVEPKKYFQKLYENFADQIVDPGIVKLELGDFEETFNSSLMSKVLEGNVKFTSGFVNRITKLGLNEQKWKNVWNDSQVKILKSKLGNAELQRSLLQIILADGLRFSDFTIVYDVDCDTSEYTTPSVFMITYSYVQFVLEVSRNLDKTIISSVYFDEAGTFDVKPYPNNAYTQIIAKELNRAASPLNTKFKDSVKEWADILLKYFEKSVREVQFAELCYYCP